MSAVIKTAGFSQHIGPFRSEWVSVLLGLAVLYVPTYVSLGRTIWQSDEQAHGPIILMVMMWLFWQKRDSLFAAPARPAPIAGWPLLIFGVLIYAVGRSQDILIFEVGSQIPVLAGALLIMHGASAVRTVWFALFYIVFMIPLPGALVDALTGPLKQWVSVIAENTLHGAGYPIARNGVLLTIGQYQLLVADACSGLNSMFSLSALGLLFMYITARKSITHNAIMLLSILPIAFAANVVRVLILVLVTYYLGDEAGQGFLHGAAGIILMVAALLLFLLLDWVLSVISRPGSPSSRQKT
jgi:exosortase B